MDAATAGHVHTMCRYTVREYGIARYVVCMEHMCVHMCDDTIRSSEWHMHSPLHDGVSLKNMQRQKLLPLELEAKKEQQRNFRYLQSDSVQSDSERGSRRKVSLVGSNGS